MVAPCDAERAPTYPVSAIAAELARQMTVGINDGERIRRRGLSSLFTGVRGSVARMPQPGTATPRPRVLGPARSALTPASARDDRGGASPFLTRRQPEMATVLRGASGMAGPDLVEHLAVRLQHPPLDVLGSREESHVGPSISAR